MQVVEPLVSLAVSTVLGVALVSLAAMSCPLVHLIDLCISGLH